MTFTESESILVERLSRQLRDHQFRNVLKWQFYDERQAIKNIGIAIPETMLDVEATLGWAAIVVDSMHERMSWNGFVAPEQVNIDRLQVLSKRNKLRNEVSQAVLDSLITGTGFLAVTQGDEESGEDRVLVRAISSLNATYVWDERKNRAKAGLVLSVGDEGQRITTLYLEDETIEETVWADGTVEESRFVHNRGRCGLVPVFNYLKTGSRIGRSELSRSLLYLIEHAVRTMLGMEYNREIYTTPQRYFTNTEPEQLGFEETDTPWEIAQKGYKVAMNRVAVIPPNEDGDKAEPKVGQFTAAPPTPYIQQMEMLSRQVAARASLSPTKFGFTTNNPPSADAIRADENSHVSKAIKRIEYVDQAMSEVAYLMLSIIDGAAPDPELLDAIASDWRDPATPTRAAAVDQAQKLVASGLVSAESRVLLKMVGFSPDEIKEIEHERIRSVSRALVSRIRDDVAGVDPMVDDLVSQVSAPE